MRRYTCLPGDGTVRSGAFALTTVQDDHIEAIRHWRNAQMGVLRQAEPITTQQQVRYYSTCVWPTLADPRPANILLSLLEEGRPIGYGGLVHIAWEHRRAEVSFLLDEQFTWDPGVYAPYFSIFLNLVKRLAFDGMGMHRLFTETYATRTHHIEVLQANGFQFEGSMRHHVRIAGRWVDSLLHGCLHENG